MKYKKPTLKYYVKPKFIKCVTFDSNGKYVLMGASQKTLKYLYEKGHTGKIEYR